MEIEAFIEATVADCIKEAIVNARQIISRKQQCNAGEKIGIFVTSLRTSLLYRAEHEFPENVDLRLAFEKAKTSLVDTANWKDIGVFDDRKDVVSTRWNREPNGRMRKVFAKPGFPDIEDYKKIEKAKALVKELTMDKSRISQIASQVKQNQDGFDFDASFADMEQSLRDMKRLAVQHETLSGQASQVTESLCAVAESLTTIDANLGAV